MERCSLLRTESLLIVVLMTVTVLSGCTTPAPEPHVVAMERGDAREALNALDWLPSAGLRTALADDVDPWQRPATTSEALRSWIPFEPVPLPATTGSLADALAAYADDRGVPLTERPDLAASVTELGLHPEREQALARLVLSFLEAERLQADAVAGLTADEMLFLGQDPQAVQAWSLRTGQTGGAAYEEEAARLVAKVDIVKNLQAADLLARAVEVRDTPSLTFPASNHLPSDVDADGDGVPNEVEDATGTDRDDPDDNGGDLWNDPEDRDGELVRVHDRPVAGGVRLPGLLILGEGDDTLSDDDFGPGEDVHFVVDLGGDDSYTMAGFGGVKPMRERLAAAVSAAGVPNPHLVKLVLDLGEGDDSYQPQPAVVSDVQGTSGGPAFAFASTPTLGGAVLGVSVLADLGGENTLRSTVDVYAEVTRNIDGTAQAEALAYGVAQGAGLFGGVGVLTTWNASNDARASVESAARVLGGSNAKLPVSTALGIAQGGGWLGVGLNAAFGDLPQTLDSHTLAETFGRADGYVHLAVAQGAARGGAGLLLSEGGAGTYAADAPLAQAGAWSLKRPEVLGLKDDDAFGDDATSVEPELHTLNNYPPAGILWGGQAGDRYEAGDFSQASALGAVFWDADEPWFSYEHLRSKSHQLPTSPVPNDRTRTSQATMVPAVALLVESGGHDVYVVQGGDHGAGGQAAGLLGGVAMLVDLAGDDRYEATGSRFNQGAAWLGQGVLLDQFGHDTYVAATHAQGYATDEPRDLVFAGVCHGMPVNPAELYSDLFCAYDNISVDRGAAQKTQYEAGTSQFWAATRAQLPTVGALVDRHGIDRYEAQDMAQGFAHAYRQYAAEAGACRIHQYAGPGSLTGIPIPPQGPSPGPICAFHYPGQTVDGEVQGWQDPNLSPPPTNGFLLGLLFDAGGNDAYVYGPDGDGGDKEPYQEGETIPADFNDWTWKHRVAPDADVQDARLPDQVLPDDGTNPEPAHDPNTLKPQQEVPGSEAVHGVGIDRDVVRDLVAELPPDQLAAVAPLRLDLDVTSNEAGTESLAGGKGEGVMYLQLTVTNPGVPVREIDFLAQGLLVGREPGGAETYTLAWDTTERDGLVLAYPDGTYSVQASAILDLGDGRLASVESDAIKVSLNNPPLLDVVPSADALSPVTGPPVLLQLSVTPDLEAPAGETVPDGEQPGAYLTVTMTGPAHAAEPKEHTVLPETYHTASTQEFVLDGACGDATCDDGAYEVLVKAEDSQNNVATWSMDLLVDGTPPRAYIDMPPLAGLTYNAGTQALRVAWGFDNDPDDVGSVAAMEAVDVYQVFANGEVQKRATSTTGFTTVEGVSTGDTVTFIAVGRDSLGNTESPCGDLPVDDPACAAEKIEASLDGDFALTDPFLGLVSTTVDFLAPKLLAVEASHEFVQPGVTPVVYSAAVTDAGSGIDAVTIDLGDDGPPFPMEDPDGDGTYTFSGWEQHNAGRSAQEEPYIYTVKATDKAGNPATLQTSGILDDLDPVISGLGTSYFLDGAERPAGRGGARVEVSFVARDAAIASAKADFSGIHDDLMQAVDCSLDLRTVDDPHDRVCTAFLPNEVADETYSVTVTVTDAAGNVATDATDVVVSNEAVTITDVAVTVGDHESVVVTWKTDKPATSRVYFGRTTELGRQTERSLDLTTEHRVAVTGLPPATNHFFVAASENKAGTETLSDPVSDATGTALGVRFTDLEAGDVLVGDVELDVDVLIEGDDPAPATITLLAQRTDGAGGRQRVATVETEAATLKVPVDTAALGDGEMRFLVQVVRGRDLYEADSPVVVVDNTAPVLVPLRPLPGLSVGVGPATFDLLVFNAGGGTDIDVEDLTVALDGAPVTPTEATLAGSGLSRSLRILLPAMEPGEHELVLSLPDAVGNGADEETTLPFVVEELPDEDPTRVDLGGRPAVRPGGNVRFLLDSVNPLQEVLVDTAPLAPGTLALSPGVSWSLDWTAPDAPSGTYLLDAITTDVYGTQQRVDDAFEVVVDADPAALVASVHPTGATTATVRVTATEPVTVRVLRGDETVALADKAGATHELAVRGLEAGGLLELTVVADDLAGNPAQKVLRALMPDDEVPPGPVSDLSAVQDGMDVDLAWSAASDASGIKHYLVERGGWSRTVSGTTATDPTAVAGSKATYTVRAVDAAGNVGEPRTVTLGIGRHIEILDSHIAPNVGNTATPFDMQVGLRHNLGGVPPVELQFEGTSVPMTSDDADCRVHCTYTATTRLPVTRIGSSLELGLAVDASGTNVELPLPARVTVMQGEATEESPGAFLLLPLLAALYVARRWRL